MAAKFLKRRSPDRIGPPAHRWNADEPRLWHFGAALGVGFAVAALGLVGLAWLAWALLKHPRLPRPGTISLHDTVGVLQLIFASVAGAGALVALVVAYRRQRIAEADSAHDRTRVFNERFTAIAAQLGDPQTAVRLAGVHAMAGLADDWRGNQQTCIDVLCAYLRIPYEPDPGGDAPAEKRIAFQASREVRHTVIRVIAAHLNDASPVSWRGRNFDFTGVVLDGGNFGGAEFSSGTVSFTGAEFPAGTVSFSGAKFSGGTVLFGNVRFSGGGVSFDRAEFSGGRVFFGGAEFSGGVVLFDGAEFSGARVFFGGAEFSGGKMFFTGAKFSGGTVLFKNVKFSGGTIDFSHPGAWSSPPAFVPALDQSNPQPGIVLPGIK